MNKIYALSDVHGRYDLLSQVLKFIDDTDKVYFLGDAADRGPDGLKCMKAILTDPRFTYIRGNHEDLMYKGVLEIIEHDGMWGGRDSTLWMHNGGRSTWDALECLPERDAILGYCREIEKMPTRKDLIIGDKRIILTHAGLTPWIKKDLDDYQYIWNRNHIFDTWAPPTDIYDNTYIIHGHTPTCSIASPEILKPEEADRVVYADGHKIDIDTGAFFTNRLCLFDLNTFESIIFTLED